MSLADFPEVRLHTVEEQGSVVGRDWQRELDLPVYWEQWEYLARPRSDAHRGRLQFILMDESETRLQGNPRLQPKQIVLPTQCSLELGHSGFTVGSVYGYFLGTGDMRQSIPSLLNLTLPTELEGDFLIGVAQFFNSALAEKAKQGLERQIFSHVCPIVWSPPGAPIGTGALVQVSLATADYPGCNNAKILSWSEQ
jgi:hypothetical protein